MAKLVDRVFEVQPAQERVRRDFGRAQDVASAVGLYLGEHEQLANAPIEIGPHPPVHGPHHFIEIRSSHTRRLGFTLTWSSSTPEELVDQSQSRERDPRRAEADRSRVGVEIAIASIGVALVACALAANQGWLDRHFLPSFF